MVLIFSIWNSPGDFMTWLDSGNAGPRSATAGDPKLIVAADPDVSVTFSNISGEISGPHSTRLAPPARRTQGSQRAETYQVPPETVALSLRCCCVCSSDLA